MGASALMAVVHEFAGLLLELGFLPAYSGRILAHFETRHGDAAGIGGLAGRVEDLRVAKDVRAVQIGRHVRPFRDGDASVLDQRSEEHTSELQSLMRISYAVFCLKKKKRNKKIDVL